MFDIVQDEMQESIPDQSFISVFIFLTLYL